jgi:hypothetical protein
MVAAASNVLAHEGCTRCVKLSEMKLELKLGVGDTQKGAACHIKLSM